MKVSTRKWIGLLSFLPLVLFIVWGIMYTFVLRREIEHKNMFDHQEVVTSTFNAYGPLFIVLALACAVSAVVLLGLMLHIIRQRNLNNAQKLLWILFLVAFGAFAFPLYWYWKIRAQRGDDRYDSNPQDNTHQGKGLVGDPSIGS